MAAVALGVLKSGRWPDRWRWALAVVALIGVAVGADPSQARRRASTPSQPAAAQPAPAAQPDAAAPPDAAPAAGTVAAEADASAAFAPPASASPSAAPPEAAPAAAQPAGAGAADAAASPPPADGAPRSLAALAGISGSNVGNGSPFEPPAASVPPSPEAPLAAKAYAVLSSYCASCHQRGVTKAPAPAGDFGNVLDLAALAREPTLVRPGNPDGSRLYQVLYARHAPDSVAVGSRGEAPTVGEVEALRDWIESLPQQPASASACPERQRIDDAELDGIMRRWLEVAGPDAARSTRFVSLAHLHNACASDAELAAYRQAVQKLLNSLSWAPEPARIETVGDALVILAFRLSDLGWVPAHWERLAKAEPDGGAVPMPEALKAHSASQHPVIRGDWLASVAGRAPLYYELLGLPDRQADLATLIGIDLAAEPPAGQLARAGLRASAETRAPRLVERRGRRDGHGLWLAHDWPAGTRAEDILDNPLAPRRPTPGKPAPPPQLSRSLLALPNGLTAFALHDAGGALRADDGRMAAGRACMSCHVSGARPFADEVRPHLVGDKPALPRDVQDAALAVYPAPGELAQLFEDDDYLQRRALIQAGVDPDLTLDGLEIITALAAAYDRDVGLQRLVADSGLEPAEAERRLSTLQGEAGLLAQRVRQAPLPRAEAEQLLAALKKSGPAVAASANASGEPGAASGQALSTGSLAKGRDAERPRLSLWSDRATYAAGDLVTLTVQTTRDCYLTLVDVDTAGKATVLFPNDFEQSNLLKAGTPQRIPADKSPYQLRFKDKGRETTVAICNTARRLPLGIDPDYERQRFTTLGLWRNFLNDALPLEAEYRANPDRARANAAARAHSAALALAKGRAAADTAAAAARAVNEPASPGSEIEERTAIQLRIQ